MLYSTVKLMLMELGDPRTRGLPQTPDAAGAEDPADAHFADDILVRAHDVIAESERLATQGDRDRARRLIRAMAEELREHAPSSGRSAEVMALARSMAELAGRI
jgi:hypothetical protein